MCRRAVAETAGRVGPSTGRAAVGDARTCRQVVEVSPWNEGDSRGGELGAGGAMGVCVQWSEKPRVRGGDRKNPNGSNCNITGNTHATLSGLRSPRTRPTESEGVSELGPRKKAPSFASSVVRGRGGRQRNAKIKGSNFLGGRRGVCGCGCEYGWSGVR